MEPLNLNTSCFVVRFYFCLGDVTDAAGGGSVSIANESTYLIGLVFSSRSIDEGHPPGSMAELARLSDFAIIPVVSDCACRHGSGFALARGNLALKHLLPDKFRDSNVDAYTFADTQRTYTHTAQACTHSTLFCVARVARCVVVSSGLSLSLPCVLCFVCSFCLSLSPCLCLPCSVQSLSFLSCFVRPGSCPVSLSVLVSVSVLRQSCTKSCFLGSSFSPLSLSVLHHKGSNNTLGRIPVNSDACGVGAVLFAIVVPMCTGGKSWRQVSPDASDSNAVEMGRQGGKGHWSHLSRLGILAFDHFYQVGEPQPGSTGGRVLMQSRQHVLGMCSCGSFRPSCQESGPSFPRS